MAEPPRVDDLIGLTNPSADDAYRVLDGDLVYRRIHQASDKFNRGVLLIGPSRLFILPSGTRHTQSVARRVGNHHVPSIVKNAHNVPNDVIPASLRLNQVA